MGFQEFLGNSQASLEFPIPKDLFKCLEKLKDCSEFFEIRHSDSVRIPGSRALAGPQLVSARVGEFRDLALEDVGAGVRAEPYAFLKKNVTTSGFPRASHATFTV